MEKWTAVMANSLKLISSMSLLALLVLSYQNCSQSPDFASPTPIASNASPGSGNGESYGGKPTIFEFLDPASPCELGQSGKPLPNRQVFVFENLQGQLVRDNCRDLEPRALDSASIKEADDGSTDLIVSGVRFNKSDQRDFDVIAASCPSGRQAIANAVRTNLVPNALDMTNTNTWWNHDGVLSFLDGVLASLPGFRLTRNDGRFLDYWRRAHFSISLAPSRLYSFSFFGKPGSVSQAWFSTYDERSADALSVIFDLPTGATTIQENSKFTDVSTSAQVFNGNRFFTVYFRTPNNTSNNVFGITPNGLSLINGSYQDTAALGDSIVVSTLQLEEVDQFCH